MYNQGLEKALHRQYGSAEPQPQLDHDHLSFSSHGNGGNDQIINVLCIHNSVQKGRKPNCPQAAQPPKRDCRQAYSVCLWLKSNHRLRAGMILPYSRITMTLNMSQFYHRSPYYIQQCINRKWVRVYFSFSATDMASGMCWSVSWPTKYKISQQLLDGLSEIVYRHL